MADINAYTAVVRCPCAVHTHTFDAYYSHIRIGSEATGRYHTIAVGEYRH